MPDLLQTACDWLTGALKANASQPVTFRRGSATIPLQATLGSTEWSSEPSDGIVETWESRDFLITAADLVLNGQRIEPVANDRIEQVIGGTTFVYQVLSQSAGQPFAYSDPGRGGMRIHTKLVSR